MTYIYVLEKDNIPFYIGKTRCLTRRKHKHYSTYGNNISLNIVDQCGDDKFIWKPLEIKWIQYYKDLGFSILNRNNGGGGPTCYSEEQKLKMRKPHKEGTGNKISISLKNNNHSKYYTKEIRHKMSISQKNISKPFTVEHIKNISKANLESKGKIVECYTLSNEHMLSFNCLREAAEWLIKDQPNISKNVAKQIKDCCLDRQKKCHGYKWKYK